MIGAVPMRLTPGPLQRRRWTSAFQALLHSQFTPVRPARTIVSGLVVKSLTLLAFVAICLFPPWQYTFHLREVSSVEPCCYSFVFSPPESLFGDYRISVQIDTARLILQMVALAFGVTTILTLWRARQERQLASWTSSVWMRRVQIATVGAALVATIAYAGFAVYGGVRHRIVHIPEAEVAKISGRLGPEGNRISGYLYNGSRDWIVREVEIGVAGPVEIITDADIVESQANPVADSVPRGTTARSKEDYQRTYRVRGIYVRPLEWTSISVFDPEAQTWGSFGWHVAAATGNRE